MKWLDGVVAPSMEKGGTRYETNGTGMASVVLARFCVEFPAIILLINSSKRISNFYNR